MNSKEISEAATEVLMCVHKLTSSSMETAMILREATHATEAGKIIGFMEITFGLKKKRTK